MPTTPAAPPAPTSTAPPVLPRTGTGTTAPPLLRDALGAELRRRRDDLGLRLVDVAERARLSVAYVSEVERGRKEPSSEVVVALCDALDAPLSAVLRDVVHRLEHAPARTPSTGRYGGLALAA
ncbi:helix-turn-helix domain-containing protein [Luteimicrobium subarcticum]|uniref:helix-turn-helix domain-containing protein n=1 Tax=Luteimicrobium subarcticum TaxID=620910 RepID=UPI001FEC9944|nr:helix-turn-helix transcriptional regulator [Luteimicrobium subarcticum]